MPCGDSRESHSPPPLLDRGPHILLTHRHYQFYKGLPQSTSSSPGDELIRWNLITLFKVDNVVSYRNRKIFELKYVSADFMIYLDLVEEFRYKSKDSFRVKINFINKI